MLPFLVLNCGSHYCVPEGHGNPGWSWTIHRDPANLCLQQALKPEKAAATSDLQPPTSHGKWALPPASPFRTGCDPWEEPSRRALTPDTVQTWCLDQTLSGCARNWQPIYKRIRVALAFHSEKKKAVQFFFNSQSRPVVFPPLVQMPSINIVAVWMCHSNLSPPLWRCLCLHLSLLQHHILNSYRHTQQSLQSHLVRPEGIYEDSINLLLLSRYLAKTFHWEQLKGGLTFS